MGHQRGEEVPIRIVQRMSDLGDRKGVTLGKL